MAINHAILDLSTTETPINPVDVTDHPVIPNQVVYSWNSTSLIIQNIDSSATVYIGDETLDTSVYGISIPPGGSVTVDDLRPTETLWAVSTTTSQISVLYIQR